jgi:N-formylglutamate deformylase
MKNSKDHIAGILSVQRPKQPLPLVFDSPHSGRDYPDNFRPACPPALLTGAEDNHIDEVFAGVTAHGASLLCALFPRTYIDANRAITDIDAGLLAEEWPNGALPTSRSHSGIGLIRRLVRPGVPLYDRKLTVEEVRRRIASYYTPYHDALAQLLNDAHYNFGQAWHVNCHAMPSHAGIPAAGPKATPGQADFVIGDRDGTSCDRAFTFLVRDTLKAMGYRVTVNHPYKGVELLQRHGRPAQGRHSLQLEVNKALYWDERRHKKSPHFVTLQQDIDRLTGVIAGFVSLHLVNLAAD